MDFFPAKNMQTPPLRNSFNLIEDARCTETNEKSIFLFIFFELWSILYSKLIENGQILSTKTAICQETKIRKNRKIDFSFISAHSASFM